MFRSADDETLARLAINNPDAFSELYTRYLGRVYGYLFARVGNTQDAQDLTAQTFLAVVENLPAYRGQGTFAGWIFSIAHHKLVDYFRSRRDETDLDQAGALPIPAPTPEEEVALRLDVETAVRAIQALLPDRAEALTLHLFGEMSAAEIGLLMDRSEEAVRMLIYRALRDLREQLCEVQRL